MLAGDTTLSFTERSLDGGMGKSMLAVLGCCFSCYSAMPGHRLMMGLVQGLSPWPHHYSGIVISPSLFCGLHE